MSHIILPTGDMAPIRHHDPLHAAMAAGMLPLEAAVLAIQAFAQHTAHTDDNRRNSPNNL